MLSLGTVLSGFSILFCGETRIQAKEDQKTVTLCVNVWVGVSQLFTVTFLFVGWFWSLAWGIKLVTLSGEYNVLFDLSNECHKNINISIVVYLWINARCHVNTMAYFGVHVRSDYQRMSGRIVNVQMFLIFEKALGNNF